MSKKSFLTQKSHKKLVRQYWLIRALVIIMILIVVYDSIVHNTPLYYIGFFYGGLLIGRFFWLTQKVEHDEESDQFNVRTNRWHLILVLILLGLRFYLGKVVLEYMHVVWVTDALYLTFIGIYRSRYKGLVKQVDDLIYNRMNSR